MSKDKETKYSKRQRVDGVPTEWIPAWHELYIDDKVQTRLPHPKDAAKLADRYKQYPFFAAIRLEPSIITAVGSAGWTCTCGTEDCAHLIIAQHAIERAVLAHSRVPRSTVTQLFADRAYNSRPRVEGVHSLRDHDDNEEDLESAAASRPAEASADHPAWNDDMDRSYSIVKAPHGWPPGFPIFAAIRVTPRVVAWYGPFGWMCSCGEKYCAHIDVARETAEALTFSGPQEEFEEYIATRLLEPPMCVDESDDATGDE